MSFDNYYRIVESRHGRFLCNPNDYYIGQSLISYGEWAEADAELFRAIVRPGDTVVDVGANIGLHTVALAKAVGESGWVYAFEPQRLVHQMLCANLALNECLNVVADRMAIGNEVGRIRLPDIPPHHKGFNYGGIGVGLTLGEDRYSEMPIITIDTIRLSRLDLIKIDAEGHDLFVLQGAAETLRTCRPAIFVEVMEHNFKDIRDMLDGLGYDVFWHAARLYSENNYFENKVDIWEKDGVLFGVDFAAFPKNGNWTVQGQCPVRSDAEWEQIPFLEASDPSSLIVARSE